MKKYINKILRESLNKLIFEDKGIEDGLISILKSGESSDVELAYVIGEGQGIDMDELVKSIYDDLLLKIARGDTVKDKLKTLLDSKKLVLQQYELTELPKGIENLKRLEQLTLYGNKLKNINRIGGLTNLAWLRLSKNQLTQLPNEISKLKNLNVLHIKNNPMSIEEIERIKKLVPDTYVNF